MRLSIRLFWVVVILALALAGFWGYRLAKGNPLARPFHLTDASQQGTFNVGTAHSELLRIPDQRSDSDLMRLDYAVPSGTAAGVWTRAKLERARSMQAQYDLAKIRVRTDEKSKSAVATTFEIKGTKGVQIIPLQLHPGWNVLEQKLDWKTIGQFKESVFSVSRVGNGAPATGTLWIDVALGAQPLSQKIIAWPATRMAMALLLGAVAAAAAFVLRKLSHSSTQLARGAGWFRKLRRDFVLGSSTVLLAVLALGVYCLGEAPAILGIQWNFLIFAAAGGFLAEWMKHGLSGEHLTPLEAFLDVTVTGILAVSSSSHAILQAPGSWSDVFLLSSLVAASVALLYHGINFFRLAVSGKHLRAISGFMIFITPYLIGALLILESADLFSSKTAALNGFYRLLLVFAFNEAVAALLLRAARKKHTGLKSHLLLLCAAAAVAAAPWIADIGSGSMTAALPSLVQWPIIAMTTAISQAALWVEVWLITGMILDWLSGGAPLQDSKPLLVGMKKGMVFGGIFMGIICGIGLLVHEPRAIVIIAQHPLIAMTVMGAIALPFGKTLIETFDGTQGFFRRLAASYRNPVLYFRGAAIGIGLAFSSAITLDSTPIRAAFGAAVGLAASAGITFLRDAWLTRRHHGNIQSWRVYLVHGIMGCFIGAGFGFYFDAAQASVILNKFHSYLGIGQSPQPYGSYILLSKWGYVRLGDVTGGVKLLFNESLIGVVSWAIPAWLFAANAVFLSAWMRRDKSPIKNLFTRQGLLGLGQNMIHVLRWGLWMAPIVFSFLRPMAEPTWYNQDGAIHTIASIFHYLTSSPQAFKTWSMGVFISILAYNSVRILIWLDHMGLRVATLVNLSFLGMDKLDQRLARFLGPAASAQCIPEGVKRFATWAPLLIPFYIPRGADWDFVWSRAESLKQAGIQAAGTFGLFTTGKGLMMIAAAIIVSALLFAVIRWIKERRASRRQAQWKLSNSRYETVLKQSGEMHSFTAKGYDVSRRSYDWMDPAGRALFIIDTDCAPGEAARFWPLLGHFPRRKPAPFKIERLGDILRITRIQNEIKTIIDIALAGDDPAEIWTVHVENLTDRERPLKITPYLEWVLNRPTSDRGHTQYNRLYPEMEYVRELNSVLAWHKQTKSMGILAMDVKPEGFLTSRIDFIGRAQSIASPRVLQTLDFSAAENTGAHPSFDPIGSLLIDAGLKPRSSVCFKLLIGLTKSKKEAVQMIARHLAIPGAREASPTRLREKAHSVRHGEILPGTPQPYYHYSEDGRRLRIHTPYTPRPYDHTMSNALGHVMCVTNRGLHTSSNGNSQQNRLTPDWPDIVTRELPGEAIYLYDVDERQWHSPTYHPVNDPDARHEIEFGVDGSAVYRMEKGYLETELTTFVPQNDPAGVYLLTIRNRSDVEKRIRVAPYFQIVLADQPENAGPLKIRRDYEHEILFFENPRNSFRTGPAFFAMSADPECVEICRGKFFGSNRDVSCPTMVEHGKPDCAYAQDDRPVASMLVTMVIPPHQECTLSMVLGQANNFSQAGLIAAKYKNVRTAQAVLASTRNWWLSLMDTVQVDSGHRDMDQYLDWLKYQTQAERIWARRGFYQASGAFGFRDQLQDSVNLIWMDPLVARNQILLHASQQFLEGDVVHWFHLLQDGRTGFAARTYASDNLLWLPWAVVEYIGLTGDSSLLDEQTPYLESEQPMEPLPAGKHGMGFAPLRSSKTDSVYRHCMRAIDRTLDRGMGAHGLPLIGAGDWNDGLDEIGSEGKGESVWLGFFLCYILQRITPIVKQREGRARMSRYMQKAAQLECALECTWRHDRYLRAIHDNGTEIGMRGSGVWEIDALTAAWAVMSGINPWRGRIMFDTALSILEKENTILLGWPPLREDTKPYLGRSSWYPEGVRENGMYCHGVQWLVGAARVLATQCQEKGDEDGATHYSAAAYRLWRKISPLTHVTPEEIEIYGGQPNKQAADLVTALDPGRMGWHGYTGAAGWLFRQALEGVFGLKLQSNQMIHPRHEERASTLKSAEVTRDLDRSLSEVVVAGSHMKSHRGGY